MRVELDGGWLLPTDTTHQERWRGDTHHKHWSMLHKCGGGVHLCRKLVEPRDKTVQFFCNVCDEKAPEYAIGFFELIRWRV